MPFPLRAGVARFVWERCFAATSILPYPHGVGKLERSNLMIPRLPKEGLGSTVGEEGWVQMKVLVIGATGPTGMELVKQALEHGHEVTAAARRPEGVTFPAGTRIVKAEVMDAASMAVAAEGQDAVLSSLGSKIDRKPTTLFSQGTRNIIAAMERSGVRRLLCITGIGAGDSKGHGGFLYDRIIQPLLLDEIYKDKTRQEQIIRRSRLDWTIFRPGALNNGPLKGVYREFTDLTGVTIGSISRADAAQCLLAHLEDASSYGKTITYCD
jgi:putative NADH-flavin reductase